MNLSGRHANDADRRVWNTRTPAVWQETIKERDHLEDWELDGTKIHRHQNVTHLNKYVLKVI